MQVTPQQVSPGDTATVSGRGFPADSLVQAELFSDPVLLGTTAADASGAFRLAVTIPIDTTPGFHTLRVTQVGGTVQAETTLFVAARQHVQAQTVAGNTATASLSRTGTSTARPARLAAALVAGGFVLVGLAWKEGGPMGPALGRRNGGGWPVRGRRRPPRSS